MIIYLWGPSDTGKTTAINEAFGAIIDLIELRLESNGWIENIWPNSQAGFKIHGFTTAHGRALKQHGNLLEHIGDCTGFTIQKRYQTALCRFNQKKKQPVRLFIDSNYSPEQVWSRDEYINVMKNRICAIETNEDNPVCAFTDLVRAINGKPPLPKDGSNEDNPKSFHFDFRLN